MFRQSSVIIYQLLFISVQRLYRIQKQHPKRKTKRLIISERRSWSIPKTVNTKLNSPILRKLMKEMNSAILKPTGLLFCRMNTKIFRSTTIYTLAILTSNCMTKKITHLIAILQMLNIPIRWVYFLILSLCTTS